MKDLTAEETQEIRKATKKIREDPNIRAIAGSNAIVGAVAGVTASGRPYAFIPTGPVLEMRIGKDSIVARRKSSG